MTRLLALVAGFTTLISCGPPDATFNSSVSVEIVEGANAADVHFIRVIHAAVADLRVVVPQGKDLALSDAIIAAQDRGVEVRVATDVDYADDPAIRALADAGVPLRLGDGSVVFYDFSTNADVGWESTQVRMTSAFVVADKVHFAAATSAGTGTGGTDVVVYGQYEDLAEDLWAEANQLYGGTDATARDVYDAPSKSIADWRWNYGTGTDARLEMWLGPQQRISKRVIDNVYAARESVWVLTDDFANEGLARALQAKAADGFDVVVVVGPNFGESSTALSRALTDADDVVKLQVTDVQRVPTVVIIDAAGDARTQGRAMFMTHDLYSAARTHRGTSVVSDQTLDGVLWQIDDWGPKSQMFSDVTAVFTAHRDRAGDL